MRLTDGRTDGRTDTPCSEEKNEWQERRDALTITVKYGSRTSPDSFSRTVGMGSNVHDLVGNDMITCRTSSAEQTGKSVSEEMTG